MRLLWPLLAFFFLVWVPEGPSPAPSAGDEGVHIAWGTDPATALSVTWQGPGSDTAFVEYGTDARFDQDADAARLSHPGTEQSVYRARLQGLAPGTTYHYRVTSGSQTSTTFTFTTAPAAPTESGFRVAAWGDHGVPDPLNPLGAADGSAPLATVSLAARLGPDFHLAAGDLSYADGQPRTWDRYFEMLQPYASRTPYMTVVGNHEREAGVGFLAYDARLDMPEGGEDQRWYSFRYGNAVFVGLDTEHACLQGPEFDAVPAVMDPSCSEGANPEQLGFLRATLEAARADEAVTWIVVFQHRPLWSDGPHGSSVDLQRIWGPLFDEYRVDLVIQAHDHLYERSHPLRGEDVAPAGTIFVTVGTAGAPLYAFQHAAQEAPAWEAARVAEEHGLLLLTFGNETVEGAFITTDDAVMDSWRISQRAEGATYEPPLGASPSPAPGLEASREPAPAFVAILGVVFLAALAVGRRRA